MPRAKLTNSKAKEIKFSKGQGTQRERAKKFDVSLAIIQSIDAERTWKWLQVNDTKIETSPDIIL